MEKGNDHLASANSSPDGDQHDVDEMDTMDDESAAKEKLTANDSSKIKFTSVNLVDSKNGEAKVDIQVVQTTIGMGKEELMKYANEPFWVRLRLFLFILFWVGWIAMLVGAVVIILVAPRCPPPPHLEWFQKSAIYQVDVESFKDSDNDGVGDLKGLLSKLDYFSQINIKTLLLSAVYAMAPGTNSILNHTAIDNKFGTMTDMEELLTQAEKKDLKIILEFIPNQSSDKHPWFEASVKKEELYKDFYVWADRIEGGPPSNWLSVKGGSAWEWNEDRGQYYLHTYGVNEPDLNLRNEMVREELTDILRFWLEKGVNGFKILGLSQLVEDETFKDEPLGVNKKVDKPQYADQAHAYTVDQDETYTILSEWRELLNNYSRSSGLDKIFMAEVSGHVNSTLKYYGNSSNVLVNFPINTDFAELTEESTPVYLKDRLEFWTSALNESIWPNWMLGNKNTKRLADRVGPELVDGIHMVSMLARGTPITYFGDELALREPMDQARPLFMPWTNENVSDSVGASLPDTNVEVQLMDDKSHLKIFSDLVELRHQPAIKFGLQEYPVINNKTFSMIRVRKGSPGYLVVVNMSSNSTVIDFTEQSSFLPEKARVEIRSRNIDSGPLFKGKHPKILLNEVSLGPKESAVFSFVPQFKED